MVQRNWSTHIAPCLGCRFLALTFHVDGSHITLRPVHQHLMLVMSLIGGSLLIFQYLLAFVLVLGWLMLPARLYVSLFGLLVG